MRLIYRDKDGIYLGTEHFKNMAELRADMKADPQRFGDRDYSLIEERPWLRIVEETNVKVEEVS